MESQHRQSPSQIDPFTPNGTVRSRLSVAAIGVAAVLLLGFLVRRSAADLAVTQAFNTLHHGPIALVTGGIYMVLEPAGAIVVAGVIAALFWWSRRSLSAGMIVGISIVLTWLPVPILKMIFTRQRPNPGLLAYPSPVSPQDWSYPSGHTAFVTALAVTLLIATAGTRLHRAMRIIAPVMVVAIAATVLILGVHYPTDVAASIVWSATVAPAVWSLSVLVARRISHGGAEIVPTSTAFAEPH